VIDNGHGIPEDEIGKIFYLTIVKNQKGQVLGLPLSRKSLMNTVERYMLKVK